MAGMHRTIFSHRGAHRRTRLVRVFALMVGLMLLGLSTPAAAAGLTIDLAADVTAELTSTVTSELGLFAPFAVEAGLGQQSCAGIGGVGLGGSGLGAGFGGYFDQFDAVILEGEGKCRGFGAFDLAFLAVVTLIVISAVRFRHATTQRRLDLAQRMLEKGMEPPAELLGPQRGNDLRRGVVLVFTGVGLLVASLVGGSGQLSPAGLIPGFIGLGYLVSHRFAIRRSS